MSSEIDQFVLDSMPHFVAIQYKKIFEANTYKIKLNSALRTYELVIRYVALILTRQYLTRDAKRVISPDLNQLFLTKFPQATLGIWQEILFSTLRAYEGLRDLFFIPEFYDFFWDSSTTAPRPYPNIERPFTRLTQIRNDIVHGLPPSDEAVWQALCDETLELLRVVLSHFAFLGNYDLIRITSREDNRYWYNRHVGLEVIPSQSPLQTEEKLSLGWLYLSKDNLQFLTLYPLLVFWKQPPSQPALPSAQHQERTAVYDRLGQDHLYYLFPSNWTTVRNQTYIADFTLSLYHTIQEIKQKRLGAEQLTWGQLQDVARAISQRRMAGALEKYRSDLYVHRKKTQNVFENFLSSDKICFVLTGKSGVGKSNFLIAQTERYAWESDVCLLMYDGAKMNPEEPLTAVVGRDFENRLQLKGKESITNIWQEIDQIIPEIGVHKVVLFIDAINENPHGKTLLRRINELVQGSPWTWLKVVVTSRPQAWRMIKRGVQLAEARYYREAVESRVGVEMEPFTYSRGLISFTRSEELPRAYAKYRDIYNLRTSYEDLPYETRTALKDPLMLRLVAETFQSQQIPLDINLEEIHQIYIDHLITSGRIAQRDFRFITQELMPLMIRVGHYTNVIEAREINQATTSDEKPLFELIHSEALLSSGRRVNQSYINLVDAGILDRTGDGQEYEVAFTGSHFFDYFASQRFSKLLDSESLSYSGILEAAVGKPFLRAAITQALTNQGKNGKYEWAGTLPKKPPARSLVAQALINLGREHSIEDILKSLWNQQVESPRNLQRLLQGVLQNQRFNLEAAEIATTLLDVAYKTNEWPILVRGASSSIDVIQALASHRILLLWMQYPEGTYQIIKQLLRESFGPFSLLNIRPFSSSMYVTALLLSSAQLDARDFENIREYWEDFWQILQKEHWGISAQFLKIWLKLSANAVPPLLESISTSSLLPYEQERFATLARYLNSEAEGFDALLINFADWYIEGGSYFQSLCDLVLAIQSQKHSKITLEITSTLFRDGNSHIRSRVLSLLYRLLPQSTCINELLDQLLITLLGNSEEVKDLVSVMEPADSALTQFLLIRVQQTSVPAHMYLKDVLIHLTNERDWQTLASMLDCFMAAFLTKPDAKILSPLHPLLSRREPRLISILVDYLSHMMVFWPNQLDSFLHKTDTSEELQQEINSQRFISTSVKSEPMLSTFLTVTYLLSSLRSDDREDILDQVAHLHSRADLLDWLLSDFFTLLPSFLESRLPVHPIFPLKLDMISRQKNEALTFCFGLFTQDKGTRDLFQSHYKLGLGEDPLDDMKHLTRAIENLPVELSTIPILIPGEAGWSAQSIDEIIQFSQRFKSSLDDIDKEMEMLNRQLSVQSGIEHIPVIFSKATISLLKDIVLCVDPLKNYIEQAEDALRLESLHQTLTNIDKFTERRVFSLTQPESSIAESIIEQWHKVIADERLSVELNLEMTRNWSEWEPYVTGLLIRKGQVLLQDLTEIRPELRRRVLRRYKVDNSDLALELTGDGLAFSSTAAVAEQCLSAWQQIPTVAKSHPEEFEPRISSLLEQVSEALGVKHDLLQIGRDWSVGTLDTSLLFRDTKLPKKLPFIFSHSPINDKEILRSLYTFLTKELNKRASVQVALLGLFGDMDEVDNVKSMIYRKMQQAYAYDIVPIDAADLLRLIASKDRGQALRHIVISQVDLVMASPFTITGATPEDMFFGRERELREISEHVDQASYAIVAGRRMGKTSILHRLHHILPAKGFYTLYHDCSITPDYDKFHATAIHNWQPAPPSSDIATFGDLLESSTNDKSLVLLLDESDKMIPIDRTEEWHVFRTLRMLANSGRAQVIFSGEHTLRDALRDDKSPLFNFANEMLLGPLDFHAVDELIIRPMKQLEIELVEEKAIVSLVWDFTSGHPNVVQRLCHRLVERLDEQNIRQITIEDVKAIIKDPGFQRDGFLSVYWEGANPLEKIITLLMADDESIRSLRTVRQTLKVICDLQPHAREIDDALQHLVDLRSILKRTSTGYEFAVKAFPRVVAGTMTLNDMLMILTEEYKEQNE